MGKVNLDIPDIEFSHKDKRRCITLPEKMDELLAEETGIHIGDGSMSYRKGGYRIVYAGNLFEDALYMQYIRSLLKAIQY